MRQLVDQAKPDLDLTSAAGAADGAKGRRAARGSGVAEVRAVRQVVEFAPKLQQFVLGEVEVIAPVNDLLEVHEAYVSMASVGIATPGHREVFMRAGNALTSEHGCESIMLAGTDLALIFQKGFDAMRSGQSGKVILEWA